MTTASEVAEALEARAAVHEELAVAARLDAVAAEHENDADLHRTAASLLRSQAAQIEAKDKALAVPVVWTEAETAALDAAYDRASRKHGWTETMYAIAAESLRLAAIRAARTAKDGQ